MSTCLDLVVTMHRVGRLHHRDILPSTLVKTESAVRSTIRIRELCASLSFVNS